MDPFDDLIFDSLGLQAEVVFVGTRCTQDNLLRNYRTGALHFVREGRAEVLTPGGEPLIIDQPSLVFFPQACAHWVRAVDDRGFDLVCAFTQFGERFQQAVSLALPEVVVLPLARLDAIRHTLEALFAEAASSAPGSKHLADRLCEVVLGYVTRHAAQAGQCRSGVLAGAADPRIASALQVIHANYATGLDVEALARQAGMSRSRFVERFKALVGRSPHNYLVNYRMGQAQRLLERRLPVKAVAGRVGYATASAFVRQFKEVVGTSPAAWAK
ncbi:AraC family transcriptional regulator [Caenimonas sedimenti]|uniref:AraC family transcriptional regulator n=1 Tax=Caenimonas sedimenti TaxID=2596921 RepID=A0A562ZQ63_9BURK|nr:AraC family transcriptional regulator [Caenimonas sedimenti]TWO70501.1 AraC family transcriptional regulator [Caenimonas sedimenti]